MKCEDGIGWESEKYFEDKIEGFLQSTGEMNKLQWIAEAVFETISNRWYDANKANNPDHSSDSSQRCVG